MIDHCIEKLLCYGQTHLLLDDLDVVYARNLIMEELKLTGYTAYEVDTDEVDAMSTPDEILEAITAHAIAAKVITENEKAILCAKLMDIVSQKPSGITDTFNSVYEKNPQKAFMWFNEYCTRNGSIKAANAAMHSHWEAKNTKGKIEVTIGKESHQHDNTNYPLCGYCQENEGFKQNRNVRTLSLDLNGEDWFYVCAKNPQLVEQGYVISSNHRTVANDKNLLNNMAAFLDYMPNYYVAVCGDCKKHEHFLTAAKSTPLFKANAAVKLKNAEHPYIEASVVDWYNNVLRIAFTNRENTVNFCNTVVNAFKALDAGNYVSASLRKVEQKYCFDIIFRNAKKTVSDKTKDIIARDVCVSESLGHFVLPTELDAKFVELEKYLTGDYKTAAKLSDKLKPFSKMVDKLIKVGGEHCSVLEAQLNIRDEVNAACEDALKEIAAFSSQNEFLKFLSSIGFEEKK